ncbi:MAG TPA: hypothetical protein VGF36_09490 [Rhodopila sp.]
MATYTVIPTADRTFRVAIVGDDGARQTLLGFATQAEAEAWITWDRFQSAVEDSRASGNQLTPADF